MGRRKILTQQVDDVIVQNHRLPNIINKISFRTLNQKRFYAAIGKEDSNIIMAHALAGAGKTYISIQKGLEMLLHKGSPIKKLIIINPTVDVGNEDKLGHLPGDLMEKIKVHNESSIYILNKIIGEAETNKLIERGKIEFMVLNFLRGRNFEDAYIILDEAQNASPLQLKTLVTRISDTTKLIIEGDLSQCDKYRANGTPAYEKSGFYDIWKRLGAIEGVYQIEFSKEDCIRSGIVKRILNKYEEEEHIELGECNLKPLYVDYSVYEADLTEYPQFNYEDVDE
jgi:phosphate starvation-inducible protein PhoH and related proteins